MSTDAPDRDTGRYPTNHVVVLFVVLVIIVFFVVRHLNPKKPPTNSEAYLAAHGVTAGQTNALRVNGTLLRFPPAYLPNPYSAGEIVAGQADHVNVEIDLASWFDPRPLARSDYLALVPVKLETYRVEDIGRSRSLLAAQWKSVSELPALGLREYVTQRDDGGWGYRVYTPLDRSAVTPKGGPLIYSCSGRPGRTPDRCSMQFQHPQGLHVEYHLSAMLLPRWREVQTKVVQTVDSFLVDEGKR